MLMWMFSVLGHGMSRMAKANHGPANLSRICALVYSYDVNSQWIPDTVMQQHMSIYYYILLYMYINVWNISMKKMSMNTRCYTFLYQSQRLLYNSCGDVYPLRWCHDTYVTSFGDFQIIQGHWSWQLDKNDETSMILGQVADRQCQRTPPFGWA